MRYVYMCLCVGYIVYTYSKHCVCTLCHVSLYTCNHTYKYTPNTQQYPHIYTHTSNTKHAHNTHLTIIPPNIPLTYPIPFIFIFNIMTIINLIETR